MFTARKLSSYAVVYIKTLAPYRIDLTCLGSLARKLGKVKCLGAGQRSVEERSRMIRMSYIMIANPLNRPSRHYACGVGGGKQIRVSLTCPLSLDKAVYRGICELLVGRVCK